jgi:predicted transposase/invertase (TIGR01784 family)
LHREEVIEAAFGAMHLTDLRRVESPLPQRLSSFAMESDSFFWQLFKLLPDTLFALLGQPISVAASYRFDAVELKKSYRLDGLFIPSRPGLPLYFVEAQFHRNPQFYTNLFAKVYSYLEKQASKQNWQAVAMFENRRLEPKLLPSCEVLINSRHVRRIYLDELTVAESATPGMKLLQLVSVPKQEAQPLVARLLDDSQRESDCERGQKIVELVEELLLRRFTELDREEVRRMFKLHDLRESKVWQEAEKTGVEKGREEGRELKNRELVRLWLADGKTLKEIAELLHLPIAEARRLARRANN